MSPSLYHSDCNTNTNNTDATIHEYSASDDNTSITSLSSPLSCYDDELCYDTSVGGYLNIDNYDLAYGTHEYNLSNWLFDQLHVHH
jgi:hypothetical protein